jgi:predicted SAM-dependent methyltransferase
MIKESARAIAKELIPYNIRKHIRNIYGSWIAPLYVANILSRGDEIKLEIGAGPRKGYDGWVTLDLSLDSDLYWDLKKKLPFPDNCVSVIYSSHVLEHFYYHELIRILEDCFRVLKSGGKFTACVPNASLYLRGYFDPASFDRTLLGWKPAVYSNLKMDIVNYIAYMAGEHKYMFDEENLVQILTLVGFQAARLRGFDPDLDAPERKRESIYVSCMKP